MEATAKSLKEHFKGQKIVFITGAMADKDVAGMMGLIVPLAKCFIAVEPPNPRAMKPEALAEVLRGLGCTAIPCDTISGGVCEAVRIAGPDGIVCALGSLYFSGNIRDAVSERFQ